MGIGNVEMVHSEHLGSKIGEVRIETIKEMRKGVWDIGVGEII